MHHTGEVMSGSPSFAELEKARKPQQGKRQPRGCDFQIPFGCPAGTGPSPNPPRHRPCRCCEDPTGHEPGWGTKFRGQSPDGKPKQAAVKQQQQQAPGRDLLCGSPSSIAVSGGCGAALRTDSPAQPGSDAPAWTPPGTAAIAGRKPLPAVKSQLIPQFCHKYHFSPCSTSRSRDTELAP